MPAPPLNPTPLTFLIDDARAFKDERPALVARSSQEALTLLDQLGDTRIDHLWLDHDLVGTDTIRPVVNRMVQLASTGSPLNVGQIHIHSANVGGGHWIRLELQAAGYPVTRSFSLGMWTRQSPPSCARQDVSEGELPAGARVAQQSRSTPPLATTSPEAVMRQRV